MATILPHAMNNAVAILTQLADYVEAHDQGRTSQQAAVWNLTKARRVVQARTNGYIVSTSNSALTAHAILRAEFTPIRTVQVVVNNGFSEKKDDDQVDDVDLLDENDTKATTTNSSSKKGRGDSLQAQAPTFTMIDANTLKSSRKTLDKNDDGIPDMKENTPDNQIDVDADVAVADSEPLTAMGLRQRKAATTGGLKSSKSNTVEAAWKVEHIDESSETTNRTHTKTSEETDLLMTLFATMPPSELLKAQAEAIASLEAYCRAANTVAQLVAALSDEQQ